MSSALIFGGAGYVGMWTWKRLLDRFDRIILVDQRPVQESLPEKIEFVQCDVRDRDQLKSQVAPLLPGDTEWIFHYSAVHREPGHTYEEYFDTNIPGAEHVTEFAAEHGIPNIFFTSSIAVYGPSHNAIDELAPKYPNSGYGVSKLAAELIHERWAAASPERRLIISRPGVIYGPGDPGNILRMIRAVKKGFFFFPGSPNIHKSYAYIEGLLDSIEFTMARSDKVIHYNYVETPTEPLSELVVHIEEFFDKKSKTIRLPLGLLIPVAHLIQFVTEGKSTIHPKRVRKAAMPTYIIPQTLIDLGFDFKYDFRTSLTDWKLKSPEDF